MNKKLEICTDTILSAKNAGNAGADRIELCSDLQTGGVTPSFSLVEKVINSVNIPVNILIRPRAGSFYYSNDEFEIICADIEKFRSLKINGIVAGILTKNGKVDYERTKRIIEISKPFEFTFHRAIDNSEDFEDSLKTIINAGADRVLTSGGSTNIDFGMNNLIKAMKNFGDKIIIMPGGGLNFSNIKTLISEGFSEFHFSASEFIEDECYNNPELNGMGHYIHNNLRGYNYSSISKIKEMKSIIQFS